MTFEHAINQAMATVRMAHVEEVDNLKAELDLALANAVDLQKQLDAARQAVTVLVSAGESIQAALDQAPAGATVRLAPGQWNVSTLRPRRDVILDGQGSELIISGPDGIAFDHNGRPADINLTIQNLVILPAGSTAQPRDGIRFLGGGKLTVEGCTVRGWGDNINIQHWSGRRPEIVIRRNVIDDAWRPNKSQGVFIQGYSRLLIEENIFRDNGWKNDRNAHVNDGGATIFSHHVYIHETGATLGAAMIRGNLFADAASHAVQARSGAVIEDNLSIGNPCGIQASGPSAIRRNIVLDSGDINTALPRGLGILLDSQYHPAGGSDVTGNILARDGSRQAPQFGIAVSSRIAVRDNLLWKWRPQPQQGAVRGGEQTNNLINPGGLADPERTIDPATVTIANLAETIAWVRAGFAREGVA
jgi:hypothetical protein